MHQSRARKQGLFILVVLWVWGYHSQSFALATDKDQTIQLSADFVDLNQSLHRGIYQGHVEMDQGETHLRAAEAITEGDIKNKLTKAIAKGTEAEPAHYWTLASPEKPPIHAYAKTICYYPEQHLIELIGNARVLQGNDAFNAPKIKFNTLTQHVISEYDGKQRTTIIINPKEHQNPHE